MTTPVETIKVEFYKTNVGTFFRRKEMNYYTTQFDKSYLINDIPADSLPTYNGKFLKVDGDITSIKRIVPSSTKLSHYELINAELESDKIPSIIHIFEAGKYYDDVEDAYLFEGKYASIMPLYKESYVATEPTQQELSVEFICLGTLQIDNLSKPEEVKINITRERYGTKDVEVIDLKSVVRYDDLTQMVVPEFMIHTQPCELTSHQVYKIVRQHVIENYNTKVARLTSNYDFCFTVEKVVDTKPYNVKAEIYTRNNNSYKPPRFSTVKKNSKLTQIFEMSWAGAGKAGSAGYGEYSVIPAWKANNFAELVENMRQYLDELMAVINAPAHECTSCNGTGHIFTSLVSAK
jgi:hypothetical protein